MKELTKKDKEIIKKAIIEYERNHYESENQEWQDVINKLIERF